MTILHVVDDEPLSVAVARRLREVLAGIKLSQKDFAQLTGWGRGYVQQRYSGLHPLDVADLEHIQNRTGIQIDYLMKESGPRFVPPTTDGGGQLADVSRPSLYLVGSSPAGFSQSSPYGPAEFDDEQAA